MSLCRIFVRTNGTVLSIVGNVVQKRPRKVWCKKVSIMCKMETRWFEVSANDHPGGGGWGSIAFLVSTLHPSNLVCPDNQTQPFGSALSAPRYAVELANQEDMTLRYRLGACPADPSSLWTLLLGPKNREQLRFSLKAAAYHRPPSRFSCLPFSGEAAFSDHLIYSIY